jgi:hypothetical protein
MSIIHRFFLVRLNQLLHLLSVIFETCLFELYCHHSLYAAYLCTESGIAGFRLGYMYQLILVSLAIHSHFILITSFCFVSNFIVYKMKQSHYLCSAFTGTVSHPKSHLHHFILVFSSHQCYGECLLNFSFLITPQWILIFAVSLFVKNAQPANGCHLACGVLNNLLFGCGVTDGNATVRIMNIHYFSWMVAVF